MAAPQTIFVPVQPNDPRKNDSSGAPYDPNTLQAPLTKVQRTKIIQWLFIQSLNTSGIDTGKLSSMTDAQLIGVYRETVLVLGVTGSPITGPPGISEITSVVDFLKQLADFLLNPVRLGELVVGVLLIGVGTKAVLSGSLSGAAQSTGSQIKRGTQAYRYRGIPE